GDRRAAAGRPERGRRAPELARRLGPPPLLACVAKVERYHECPNAFYAAHGLALAERPVHRLTMPDVGELYNAALSAAGPALAARADRTNGAGGSGLSGGIPAAAAAALRAAVEAATAAALQQDRRALFSATPAGKRSPTGSGGTSNGRPGRRWSSFGGGRFGRTPLNSPSAT
ncbi:hypothetical protein AB1399_03050, partial [Hydrogenibacillus schlegelii]